MESECTALVIFGVTGELVRKKVFASLYELELTDRLGMPVIGVGRSDWTQDTLRDIAEDAIREHAGDEVVDASLNAVLERLSFIRGDYTSPTLYAAIAEQVVDHQSVLCYLAVPPSVFADVVEGLGASEIGGRTRLLIEKPFGSDLESARQLATLIDSHFDSHQLFAVDHYLQKESLQNVMVLRFANRVLEPIWSGAHIDSVSVVMAEQFGIEGRAGFFDTTGTLRDVVQNHALQVVAALAMEPPASSSSQDVNECRTRLLAEIEPLALGDVVFGQYAGYLDVEGVAPDSMTDTFVRARLAIDNDRWHGVTWTIVAGKALAETRSEIVVTFKGATAPMFISAECEPEANRLCIAMAPEESVTLTLQARSSAIPLGTAKTALTASTGYRPDERLDAYARIFDDARRGDHTQFVSRDSVDQCWRIVDSVIHRTERRLIYARGTWGPESC